MNKEQEPQGISEKRLRDRDRVTHLAILMVTPRTDSDGNPRRTLIDEAVAEAFRERLNRPPSAKDPSYSVKSSTRWDATALLRKLANTIITPEEFDSLQVEDAQYTLDALQAKFRDTDFSPSNIYDVLGIQPKRVGKKSDTEGGDGSNSRSRLKVKPTILPQPDPNSANAPVDVDLFTENWMAQPPEPGHLGQPVKPVPTPVSTGPINDWASVIKRNQR